MNKETLYEKMCVGCPKEKICHDKCEHCDEYEEALNEEIKS